MPWSSFYFFTSFISGLSLRGLTQRRVSTIFRCSALALLFLLLFLFSFFLGRTVDLDGSTCTSQAGRHEVIIVVVAEGFLARLHEEGLDAFTSQSTRLIVRVSTV